MVIYLFPFIFLVPKFCNLAFIITINPQCKRFVVHITPFGSTNFTGLSAQ